MLMPRVSTTSAEEGQEGLEVVLDKETHTRMEEADAYSIVQFAEELVSVLSSALVPVLGKEPISGKREAGIRRLGRVECRENQL